MSAFASRSVADTGVQGTVSLLAPGMAAKRPVARRPERHEVRCEAWLVDENRQTTLKCRPVDLSDSGIYLTLDPGPKIAIGQRYELQLAKTGLLDRSPFRLEENRRPATVTRVELLVGPAEERLGVALRFDRPMRFMQGTFERA